MATTMVAFRDSRRRDGLAVFLKPSGLFSYRRKEYAFDILAFDNYVETRIL